MAHDNCIDTLSGASLSKSVTMSPTWRGWFLDGKQLLATTLMRVATFAKAWALLALWRQRHTQRRRLAALDARLLADIGLSPAQVQREVQKPFWIA